MIKSRAIMLVDFNYFFAQCEKRRKPNIKDNIPIYLAKKD